MTAAGGYRWGICNGLDLTGGGPLGPPDTHREYVGPMTLGMFRTLV